MPPPWLQAAFNVLHPCDLELPSRLFDFGDRDYELFEEDGAFVLSVELPGFDPEEITARYENGVLEVRLPVIEGAATRGHAIEVEG